jgi:diguanylate cyclase
MRGLLYHSSLAWLLGAGIVALLWHEQQLPITPLQLLTALAIIASGLSVLCLIVFLDRQTPRLKNSDLIRIQLLLALLAWLWLSSLVNEARPVLMLLLPVILGYGLHHFRPTTLLLLTLGVGGAYVLMLVPALATGTTAQSSSLARLEIVILSIALLWLVVLASGLLRSRRHLSDRIVELEEAVERLMHLANHDDLTGVANRRRILTLLNRARDSHKPFSIAMFDLDHFKRVNDVHGHGVGDEILSAFAHRVELELRGEDQAAWVDRSLASMGRFGGEEFLVIFPRTHREGALRAAERIRQQIGRQAFVTSAGAIHCTVSAGVAESRRGESLNKLLARADQALYAAKSAGRDQVAAEPMNSCKQGKASSRP